MSAAETPETLVERMVVMLDASQESLAVIEAASWLAGTLARRLDALFVEEDVLTRAAGFPFAREISRIGAAPRALDPDAMSRDLRAAAERARQAVAAAASRGSVEWQFDVVRGHYEHAMVERAAGGLVALGIRGGATARRDIEGLTRRRRGPYLLVGPRAALRAGPVVVHAGEREAAGDAGALARRIAAALDRPLVAVPELADVLAAAGVPGAAARAGGPEAGIPRPGLIVFAAGALVTTIRLEVVLEYAPCPVLVTAAAEAGGDPGS